MLDLDIQSFFDSIDHDLLLKAVEANTDQPWVVLYVKRWLRAPLQHLDGSLAKRDRGTPQGSAVSPVLANLFLHYAFDAWMAREFPAVQFERYVDDAVVHCVSERQASMLWQAIGDRLGSVGLQLHPAKTQIVYCRDQRRRAAFERTSFTFLGYTFRPRAVRARNGNVFTGFGPAISKRSTGSADRSATGGSIGGSRPPWRTSPGGSIRSCEGGCSTTGRSTAPSCIPSWRASTTTWCAGCPRSTNGCAGSKEPTRGGS